MQEVWFQNPLGNCRLAEYQILPQSKLRMGQRSFHVERQGNHEYLRIGTRPFHLLWDKALHIYMDGALLVLCDRSAPTWL